MKNITNFLFETGMLKKTPRTGYQFLGSGQETVAEHSFRTAIIGYVLSKQIPNADTNKTVLICLFHDLHEARTGDLNYVNKQYVKIDEEKAINDMTEKLPFGEDIKSFTNEFNKVESIEAQIAKDADQLDLIIELKEQLDLGNKHADEWIQHAIQRLITDNAKKMAQEVLKTNRTDWWFDKKLDIWVNGPE